MVSCTEFIPAYSELFAYIEENHGRAQVDHFWEFLFAPHGKFVPLINFVKEQGIRGCWTYWSGTLNEEAADFTMYLNEKRGFFMYVMHKCPSKGRLLKLKDEIGIEPYKDYCLHCDSYRLSIEKVGLKYIYNFCGQEKAACSLLVYDPAVFDGRVIIDEDTLIMDRKASQNEYFHRDFHSFMNNGVHYVGENFGLEEVREYLSRFTRNVYRPVIAAIQEKGLAAIADKIADTYRKEKAEDALKLELSDTGLTVHVSECPGIAHLKATGRDVSPWYVYTTSVVMEVLAEAGGFKFDMISYDPDTGKAEYEFTA